MKTVTDMIAQLEKKGVEHVRDINEFYGSTDKVGIWMSGEDEFNGVRIYNAGWYEEDPQEEVWVMGVEKSLYEYLNTEGYYAEPYDNGTLMVYPG